jgi:hypothetical protein
VLDDRDSDDLGRGTGRIDVSIATEKASGA